MQPTHIESYWDERKNFFFLLIDIVNAMSPFAFIGLERMSGIMAYDITTPNKPKFIEYFTTRNFVETDIAQQGDLGPEGLIFVSAKDSPNGKPLLVVGNEVSGSTAVYQVNLQ